MNCRIILAACCETTLPRTYQLQADEKLRSSPGRGASFTVYVLLGWPAALFPGIFLLILNDTMAKLRVVCVS